MTLKMHYSKQILVGNFDFRWGLKFFLDSFKEGREIEEGRFIQNAQESTTLLKITMITE